MASAFFHQTSRRCSFPFVAVPNERRQNSLRQNSGERDNDSGGAARHDSPDEPVLSLRQRTAFVLFGWVWCFCWHFFAEGFSLASAVSVLGIAVWCLCFGTAAAQDRHSMAIKWELCSAASAAILVPAAIAGDALPAVVAAHTAAGVHFLASLANPTKSRLGFWDRLRNNGDIDLAFASGLMFGQQMGSAWAAFFSALIFTMTVQAAVTVEILARRKPGESLRGKRGSYGEYHYFAAMGFWAAGMLLL